MCSQRQRRPHQASAEPFVETQKTYNVASAQVRQCKPIDDGQRIDKLSLQSFRLSSSCQAGIGPRNKFQIFAR